MRSVLVFFAIMAAAIAGTWIVAAILSRLPPIITPLFIFVTITGGLAWRVWWGIKNPPGPSNNDHW